MYGGAGLGKWRVVGWRLIWAMVDRSTYGGGRLWWAEILWRMVEVRGRVDGQWLLEGGARSSALGCGAAVFFFFLGGCGGVDLGRRLWIWLAGRGGGWPA